MRAGHFMDKTDALSRRYLGDRRRRVSVDGFEQTMSRAGAAALGKLEALRLVVDSVSRTVRSGARPPVSALGCEVPFRMLEALLDRRGEPAARSELYEYAWREPYAGKRHDARIHYNLSRLRRILGETTSRPRLVERAGGGWKLAVPGGTCWIRPLPEQALPDGQLSDEQAVLAFVAERGVVTNRDLCRRFGFSRTTALRRLESLVSTGRLGRLGGGRGAWYRLEAGQSVAA